LLQELLNPEMQSAKKTVPIATDVSLSIGARRGSGPGTEADKIFQRQPDRPLESQLPSQVRVTSYKQRTPIKSFGVDVTSSTKIKGS
jgi:hypothetical protein